MAVHGHIADGTIMDGVHGDLRSDLEVYLPVAAAIPMADRGVSLPGHPEGGSVVLDLPEAAALMSSLLCSARWSAQAPTLV